MRFSVIYDACVLYPAPLRDFLIRLALSGLFAAVEATLKGLEIQLPEGEGFHDKDGHPRDMSAPAGGRPRRPPIWTWP
jgi:hypothetical protein